MFLEEYDKLTTNKCTISKLGEIFSFYYADTNDVQILARDCIELDIRSAFPTICRLMFGEDHAFVKNIFNIDSKFERNKFISITLTKQSKIDDRRYLEELNNYCKMFIFGKVFNNYDNINILEFKKDGMLFNGELSEPKYIKEIETYFEKNKVNFNKMQLQMYMRFNKTSIYQYKETNNNDIVIKGKFKDCPEFLYKEVFPALFKDGTVNKISIKKYYNRKYFEILKQNHLIDKIKYYYGFGENQFLDLTGKLNKSINEIDPNQVLIQFLYPILSLLRSER
ncbi:MAG: hypothetical protein H8D97_01475 [Proteobacteria bacterium]|nr:hypothetical protein [Pseudomonadota bacterium]